ncbi:MAG: hypothetical protein WA949_10200 [Phormidesmis sp.]
MGNAKRIAGITLSATGLLLSFLCLGRAIETGLDRNPNRQGKRETVTAGLLIGLPVGAGALWILRDLERDRTLIHSQKLQSLFYKAIKANSGRLSAVQFAMLAQVSLDEAKAFLDTWSGAMNAQFDVDESGTVIYCFRLPEA